jgi:FKBP-type peptidyl-prolyl cis-trans isomerase 2
MSRNIVQNGSRIQITFCLKNENNEVIFGAEKGKKETLNLNGDEPLFDLFRCLIGKEEGFVGKFKVNQQVVNEQIETLSIENLPKSLTFKKNTILKVGSNNQKIGFIKEVKEDELTIEVSKPFRHIQSILSVNIIKVD